MLDRLRGGLIVSCQAPPGSPLADPQIIAALAAVAQKNGAVAVRIEGVENLRAVRARVTVPIIGLIKRPYDGYEPYITPTAVEVEELLGNGAHIVALDATGRLRPQGAQIAGLIERIHGGGALAMADCATVGDGQRAFELGADFLGTTLCGYTKETAGAVLPAVHMLTALRATGGFVLCEGGIHTPKAARLALEAGADAIVVGTAITNVDWLVAQFAQALRT